MQTTHPAGMTYEDALHLGGVRKEIITGPTDAAVTRKMDKRLKDLKARGEVLHERRQMTAIGSLLELASELATAHNRGQRKRLREELHKLIDAL